MTVFADSQIVAQIIVFKCSSVVVVKLQSNGVCVTKDVADSTRQYATVANPVQ